LLAFASPQIAQIDIDAAVVEVGVDNYPRETLRPLSSLNGTKLGLAARRIDKLQPRLCNRRDKINDDDFR
jgi:hypothetical protein